MKKKICLLLSCMIAISMTSACGVGKSVGEGNSNSSINAGNEVVYNVVLHSKTGNGVVSFDKEKVQTGDSITITIEPDKDWRLTSLTINEEEKSNEISDGKLTLENVNADIIVKVCFEEVAPYAAYISFENAPIIDGNIDAVWDTSYTFFAKNQNRDTMSSGMLFEDVGYVKVMWNETGFYFLGIIYDLDVVSKDLCNFWVAEEYIDNPHTMDEESGNPILLDYSNKNLTKGYYALIVSSEGELVLPTGYDLDDLKKYCICSASITDFGYVVEAFMPHMSEKPLVAGAIMGFDVSIDYYSGLGNKRDYYANWNGKVIREVPAGSCPVWDGKDASGYLGPSSVSHGYWGTPAALAKVVLQSANEQN